ncbi:PTS sugar transporter subunit IIA [Sporolactobacillus sp. THM7-4]|nr:PTS sugar transporter subunit IIA [Sporolactobacillus sp. THM7-4]
MEDELFTINNVEIGLKLFSKDRVLSFLAQKGVEVGAGKFSDRILADLLKRENMLTTSVGKGIAIPHCKSQNISKATLLFVRLDQPVIWNDKDQEKVNIIFGILTSNTTDNIHLSILSRLAKNLLKNSFLKILNTAQSKEKIFDQINEVLMVKGGSLR